MNMAAPNRATGTPDTVLYRLMYTCVQLTVALMSQKLRYLGSNSIR